MDKKAIQNLMQRAGFTWIQRESQYNLERVERLIHLARNEALDQAIHAAHKSVDSLESYCPQTLEYAKDAIRALKEQK
jgi:hypothetical protein